MKYLTPKKSNTDFVKITILTTDHLKKIKGGSRTIIVDGPTP